MEIVITHLPIASFSYYEWLLLGLYELERKGEIRLKFKINILSRIVLLWCDNKYISGGLRRLINDYTRNPSYTLRGYVIFKEGADIVKRSFAYDAADAPFIYEDSLLNIVDVYFKMQCPKSIDREGFPLNKDVRIPYCDAKIIKDHSRWNKLSGKRRECQNLFTNVDKVKPAMVGPRRLAWSCKYRALKRGYDMMVTSVANNKEGFVMAYFGNSKGPIPSDNVCYPDFNWESDIVAYYDGKINHPNEKRAKAVKLINSIQGCGNDARIIHVGHSDSGGGVSDLFIPYNEFGNHVSKFMYNLNISGYRMSIPNRFIESFMVGTGIVTDKLFVKWYKPFGASVVESINMGYLLDEDVDWIGFKRDLEKLPQITSNDVLTEYYEKWTPIALAEYVISVLTSRE